MSEANQNLKTKKMPDIRWDIDQGSDEWMQLRLGSIGGSQVSKALTRAKGGGPGKTSMDLLYQLATEIMTGEITESYVNETMLRGNELEPIARSTFEFITGLSVEVPGIIVSNKPYRHYSPDGICSDGKLLEIKCPLYKTQLKRLEENRLPPEYEPQCNWGMYISELSGLYFMSFHPELEPLIIEVEPDLEEINKMKERTDIFIETMLKIVERWSK